MSGSRPVIGSRPGAAQSSRNAEAADELSVRGTSGLRELAGRMFRWRIGLRWLLVALFSPLAFFLGAAVLVRLFMRAWPILGRFGHIA